MNSDKALRPIGDRGESRNRNGRRIRCDNRLGLQRRAEFAKDCALGFLILGRRLDDDVAIVKRGVLGRRSDPLVRHCPRGIVETVAFDVARQRGIDIGQGLFDAVFGNIVKIDLEPGDRADLGDALAHLACADHSHFADFGAHPLTRTFATARIISNIALR